MQCRYQIFAAAPTWEIRITANTVVLHTTNESSILSFPTNLKLGEAMSFQYIAPTNEQKEKMQVFRDKFEALAQEISGTFPPSRGISLAVTKLEESAFWLNKAITNNDNR